MGLINITKLLHCPLIILSSAVPTMKVGINERINYSKKESFGNAENQTRGSWVKSANAAFVLCRPLVSLFLNGDPRDSLLMDDYIRTHKVSVLVKWFQ